MDRREFASLLPALLAAGSALPRRLQRRRWGTMDHPVMGAPTPGPDTGQKPTGPLPEIVSGVYTPGKGYGSQAKRVAHRYLVGMLKAGNIQIEIHETIQERWVRRMSLPISICTTRSGWCARGECAS